MYAPHAIERRHFEKFHADIYVSLKLKLVWLDIAILIYTYILI